MITDVRDVYAMAPPYMLYIISHNIKDLHMTELEIVLSTLLVIAVLAAVSVWLWYRHKHDTTTRDCATMSGVLKRCGAAYRRLEMRYKISCQQCKTARLRAANEFASARQQEAQHLGVSYTAHTDSVAGVMRSLQNIMSQMQTASCDRVRGVFMQQKREFIAGLGSYQEATGNPVLCADIQVAMEQNTASLQQGLSTMFQGSSNAGGDAAKVVAEIEKVWTLVAAQICDTHGVVDYELLDAFMTSVFEAVCQRT
jgi:hypothetical protein